MTRVRSIVTSDGRALSIGAVEKLPQRKLTIRPASFADDAGRSPRGVFRNGRGGG